MNFLDLIVHGIEVQMYDKEKFHNGEILFRFRKGDRYFQRAIPRKEIILFNGGAVSSSLLEGMICREVMEYFKNPKDFEENKDTLRLDDWVICTESGVVGRIINFYTPTSCEEQIMVKTRDGRRYHAPKRLWKHYHFGTTATQVFTDELAFMEKNPNLSRSPELLVTENSLLNPHGQYAVKFAQNHGISINDALEHPTVKAHAEVINSLNETVLKEIYPKQNFLKNGG